MLRSILAVVVGYILMAALVMLSFTPAFFAPELVFEKDSIDVTMAFMVFSLAMGGVAAAGSWPIAAFCIGVIFAISSTGGLRGAWYRPYTADPTPRTTTLATNASNVSRARLPATSPVEPDR